VQGEARPIFDEGLGTFVYSYRVDPLGRIRLGAVAGVETAPEFCHALFSWGARNQRSLARIYRTGIGSLGEAARAADDAGLPLSSPRAAFEAHRVAEVFTVTGHDSQGFGVFLTVPRAAAGPAVRPGQRRALERLAAELVMGARLRARRRQFDSVRLSASETRVACLISQGASDKRIAGELRIALSTVSTFTRRIRAKLGCLAGEELLALRPLAQRTSRAPCVALLDRLTPSECEVVSELLVGRSYEDIAKRRGVSVRTVESQCSAVFRKCDVSGKRELAAVLLTA